MKKPATKSPRAPNALDIYFGKQIRKARLEREMSQQDVGEALGVSFQQVQKYERGTNRIAASRLYEICQVLRWPIADVFEGVPLASSKAPKAPRQVTLPPGFIQF